MRQAEEWARARVKQQHSLPLPSWTDNTSTAAGQQPLQNVPSNATSRQFQRCLKNRLPLRLTTLRDSDLIPCTVHLSGELGVGDGFRTDSEPQGRLTAMGRLRP